MLRRTMSHLAIVALLLSVSAAVGAQSAEAIHEVLKTGPDSISGVAEPASGRFIVYAQKNAIKIYNRQSQKTTSVTSNVVTAVSGALSISRSGARLVFPAYDDAKGTPYIWSLELDTITGSPRGEPRRVSVVPSYMASVSSDGRWIALIAIDQWNPASFGAGGPNRLLVTASEGGDARMLDSAQSVRTPWWSPDGRWIFYARLDKLMRVSSRGGQPETLGLGDRVYGVSPDSKYIGVRALGRGRLLADIDGKILGSLPAGPETAPIFGFAGSEPARLLAFHQVQPTTLKTVSLESGSITPYPITEQFAAGARFSPDGSRLAMTTIVNGRRQLVVYDVRSRRRRVLPTSVAPEGNWQWSPNGASISFLSVNESSHDIDINAIDVATGRLTNLPKVYHFDLPTAATVASMAAKYHWRSDSKSFDYVEFQGGKPGVTIKRITLAGERSTLRTLPQIEGWRSAFRPASDSLLIIATASQWAVLALPLPSGEPRTLFAVGKDHGIFGMPGRESPISPDGKWIVFGTAPDSMGTPQWAIVSTDGKTFRFVGSPMPCYAYAEQWMRDSKAFVGVGISTCEPRNPEVFVVPIDGGPPRHIALPPNQDFQLTPDGKSLLVAVDEPRTSSIVAIQLDGITRAGTGRSAGKP